MVPLHITLFGGFEARLGSGEVIDLHGRKTQALLACLALPPGAPRLRDKIVALLWSDRGESQARGSLRQALAELRKALGDADPPALVAGRDAVSLDAGAVEVDVAEFERLVDDGAPEALERAANLYQGDLLDGIGVRDPAFEDWLQVERERLHDRAGDAFSRLLAHQTSAGKTEAAIVTARRLLALDPLQETTHCALMRLYAGRGDRPMALKQYQACRDVLQAELGLKPEAETERLLDEIRKGETEPDETEEATARSLAAAEPLPLPDKPSIAVLPFENRSADADQEFFADGIAEDIITELSRFRSLFVIARNSAFSFKGQSIEVKDIGRKLGVRYVVEGSVRRAGNRVRVTAQLVDAVADMHLWAERYDRDLDDIFAVQDEVTDAIVTAIEPTLGSAERQRAHRKPTESLDAWGCYQRGLWHLNQYKAEDSARALDFLQRAIDLDPTFASAHAGLAFALYYYVVLGFSRDRDSDLARAFEAGKTAVMLDESDPFAHVALGRVHTVQGEHDKAVAECDAAISLNPNYASAHFGRAHSLWQAGRPEEAIVSHDEAMRLSPRDPLMWAFMASKAIALILLERYDEALAWAQKGQRQSDVPIWALLPEVSALGLLSRIEEARAALERVRRLKPDVSCAFVGQALAITHTADHDHFVKGLAKAGLEA